MISRKDNKGRSLKEGESQLSDGSYRFRYTDSTGKRHTIYSWKLIITDRTPKGKKNKPALRELEDEIKRDILDKIQPSSLTLNDLFDKYIKLKVSLSELTLENYKYLYDKDIRNSELGHTSIKNIQKSMIKEFYTSLYEKGYAISTIQNYQNFLFPTFTLAMEDNLIRNNPCLDAMKIFSNVSTESEKEALSKKEQKILQDFLRNDLIYKSYFPLFMFMLSTGTRIGEALGLTWDDIDFDNKRIIISHQVIYKKVNGKTTWRAGKLKWAKTAKQSVRIIPIHDDIIKILQRHKEDTYLFSINSDYRIETAAKEIEAFNLKPYYEHFVFISANETLPQPNTINRTLKGIVNRYNKKQDNNDDMLLPHISCHTLRYTFATRCAENKMSPKVLQTIMGHKNIGTTLMIYTKISEEWKADEVNDCKSPIDLSQNPANFSPISDF